MDDSFFRGSGSSRDLPPAEVAELEQWAIDNFTISMKIKPIWHPVVRRKLYQLRSMHLENLKTKVGSR